MSRPCVALYISLLGCTSSVQVPSDVWDRALIQPRVEAVSVLGDTLHAFPLSAETRTRYETQLAEARAAYGHAPANADSIIWLGRRLAYLGRIREAIDVYTRGLALHPQNAWLYRHRGHR